MGASKEVRIRAGRRDLWRCQWDETLEGGERCEKRFQDGDLIDMAHINHDKNSPLYDTVDWILSLCLGHHEAQHRRMKDDCGANLIEFRIRKTGGRHE